MVAIYTRQSVDKRDSISIETQEEECRKKADNSEKIEVFSDKGISGKSVENRPEFQRMMNEVRKGNVSKIIIYKYDRISRSLRDFVNMQFEFEKYNTAIVSVNESFDTSTNQGKAMLSILMTFAQLERETIQQRITDNYYARGEKGLYLGGYAPFGYTKIETAVNGKKTYTFEENTEESVILNKIYEEYINGNSLGEIARKLNESGVPTRKGKPWASGSISRMLKNPVYVKANADVYNYLKGLGACMNNGVEDYKGENGCYVYGKVQDRNHSKFVDMKSDYVTIGLHKGIIDASVWLAAQQVFQNKKGHSNLGTGNLTWLQGIIKCKCGYTMYVKRYRQRGTEYRYLYCRGRKNNACKYPRTMIRTKEIEDIAEEALLRRLDELKNIPDDEVVADSPEINSLKIDLSVIDKQIENIVAQITQGNEVMIKYLNQSIARLDSERKRILEEISQCELKSAKSKQRSINIDDVLTKWKSFGNDIKKQIAKEMIKTIVLEGNNMDIIFY